MSFGLTPDELAMICSIFREHHTIEAVVIFGSRAMGNFKPGSDVDLALRGNISEELLTIIRNRLNEELPLPYVFDVFDERAISNTALRQHITEHGKTLYLAAR